VVSDEEGNGQGRPTFNYIVVHAYGSLRIIEDETWLRGLVERSPPAMNLAGRAWKSRMRRDFIKTQLRASLESRCR